SWRSAASPTAIRGCGREARIRPETSNAEGPSHGAGPSAFRLAVMAGTPDLLPDLRLDQLGEEAERFLPSETAGLGRNAIGDLLLHDCQLSAAGDRLEGGGHLHLTGHI